MNKFVGGYEHSTITKGTKAINTHTNAIRFDRITKDFALYLNGELIGYSCFYSEGESRLNDVVYDLLRRASHADISDLTPEDAEP